MCSPRIADCYVGDFMLSHSDTFQAGVTRVFNFKISTLLTE